MKCSKDVKIKDMKDEKDVKQQPSSVAPAQSLSVERLVSVLSTTLDIAFCQGFVQPAIIDGKTHSSTFMFQCKTKPDMKLQDYLTRIVKYTDVSGEALILSMIHINRIYRLLPNFPVNLLTIHRLLLTSVLISAKFYDDRFLNNARYARVGGVDKKEMNVLEVELLFLLDFDLFVTTEEYHKIYRELVLSNPLLIKDTF